MDPSLLPHNQLGCPLWPLQLNGFPETFPQATLLALPALPVTLIPQVPEAPPPVKVGAKLLTVVQDFTFPEASTPNGKLPAAQVLPLAARAVAVEALPERAPENVGAVTVLEKFAVVPPEIAPVKPIVVAPDRAPAFVIPPELLFNPPVIDAPPADTVRPPVVIVVAPPREVVPPVICSLFVPGLVVPMPTLPENTACPEVVGAAYDPTPIPPATCRLPSALATLLTEPIFKEVGSA